MRRILALCSALIVPVALHAQGNPRPHLQWRTVRTEHFDVHYPTEMEKWTRDVAGQLEAVHGRVSALVGYAPTRRITVVAEDPFNQSNGSAWPFLNAPAIYVWPTPPDPRSAIGHSRGFGELLAVHEYAHVAHLVRPSRNARQRFLWSLSPIRVGPVARRAPRWVTEGYATYVEGRLTGSGRPHGVLRPAVLRQWALEGKLPTYGQLSSTEGFLGGAMAYLAGSAYLEWLVEQRGDSSLVHLWRRMSARQSRSFDDAFAGVYGGTPADLYGRFTVELTAKALQARAALAQGGLAVGDTVQVLSWYTGDPAVSPNGRHLAIPLRARDRPARVVIWKMEEEPEDTAAVRARERARRLDPEDVPAIQWRPRSRRALATLHPVGGRAFDSPRFLDSTRVLVTRVVPLGDGAERPDLFEWNWRTGQTRRITRGAAIRHPDPAPDGRTAAAVRCQGGSCDLVRVDLASGGVTTLAQGSPTRAFYRPRWSPDGHTVAVSASEGGRWRLVLVDPSTGVVRYPVPRDTASRYDAAWLPDGRLVSASERGGVVNLETVDPRTGATRPLSRVTGAAVAPAPDPATGAVFFLNLHTRGLDLHRVHPNSVAPGQPVALDPRLWPAAPVAPARPADTFPRAPLPPGRRYGLGPRSLRLLPAGGFGGEGAWGGLVVASTDPVGRFTALAQGAWGTEGAWRGGALNATYRGIRPHLGGDLFWTEHWPGEQPGTPLPASRLNAEYAGAAMLAELGQDFGTWSQRLRAGASLGRLELPELEGRRQLAWAQAGIGTRIGGNPSYLTASLGGTASGGSTGDQGWTRLVASAGVGVGRRSTGLRADATYGTVNTDAPLWERFAVGGERPPLFEPALLSQRIPLPGLPVATVSGRELVLGRVTATVGGFSPYFMAASTDGVRGDGYRVIGIDNSSEVRLPALLRLPSVRITSGVVYPLDEPFRHRVRGYFTLGFRP